MDSGRGVFAGLALSVAVHAAVAGALVYAPSQGMVADKTEPIEISFVQYAPSRPIAASKVLTQKSAPKKSKGIPVPRHESVDKEQAAPVETEPSELEKAIRAKIKKQEAQLLKLSTHTDIPPAKKSAQTSSELLTDPVKGKIFVGYFGSVKHAIQDLLVQKYAKRAIGHGSVYLYFVLNDKGALEKVTVVDKESTADEYLRELAIQCLRDAAPFGNFPQSLGTERISFNVTIYFEER
jgi:hypothetical protein